MRESYSSSARSTAGVTLVCAARRPRFPTILPLPKAAGPHVPLTAAAAFRCAARSGGGESEQCQRHHLPSSETQTDDGSHFVSLEGWDVGQAGSSARESWRVEEQPAEAHSRRGSAGTTTAGSTGRQARRGPTPPTIDFSVCPSPRSGEARGFLKAAVNCGAQSCLNYI